MTQIACQKPNISNLLKRLGDFEFGVNSWGSCQYSSALSMYTAYFELRKEYTKDQILDFFRIEYGYEISFSGIREDDDAIEKFFDIYREQRGKDWDFGFHEWYNTENWKKVDDYGQRFIRNLHRAKSADDLFFVNRNAASNLWNTAPRVAKAYFIDFKAENLPDVKNQTGMERGPIGNLSAQSLNVLTGLCCALLVDYEIVKNTNSFKGFDT